MMKKIAIIGTGISGLSVAWLLHEKYDITVFEKNDVLGGHTNTQIARRGDIEARADTGFMVFNHRTYPNLVELFKVLGVETVKTDMSFGIQSQNPFFEFCSDNAFVQWKNIFRPKFWRMVRDIVVFNREVEAFTALQPKELPLKEVIAGLGLSREFADRYLLPMAGAIWSTHKDRILEYPAKNFVQFFKNHGLLAPKSFNPFTVDEGRLDWYTVVGGASTYIDKMIESFREKIRLSTEVTEIRREEGGVVVRDAHGKEDRFDDVICASHPYQTKAMLADADEKEKGLLELFEYSQHDVVMHSDTSLMISNKRYWSSWTYREGSGKRYELSYYMNRLQSIRRDFPVIVTLDPLSSIAEDAIFYRTRYAHPIFSVETESAKAQIQERQGRGHVWYCGAWLGHGFHEDGLKSAIRVAEKFGVQPPWKEKAG